MHSALAHAGIVIHTRHHKPADAAGCGVFVFDQADDDLLALLARLCTGDGHVFALAVSDTPPATEPMWALLESGAADVL